MRGQGEGFCNGVQDFVEDFERTASNFRGIFPMGDEKLTASTRELFNECAPQPPSH